MEKVSERGKKEREEKEQKLRPFLSSCKEITNSTRSNSNKHLLKLTPTTIEERNSSLPSYGPGQHGFAGTRWTHQQHTFGKFATQPREPLHIPPFSELTYETP